MSAKQDRAAPRTAADIDRKYNFGKSFAEVMGLAEESKRIASEAGEAVIKLDKKLDQEEIFNRLTNNGEVEGIYRDKEGNIYVNASYIKSGEFLADLIKAGVIKSKDGTSIVIDLDNGEVDLVGNITTTSIDENGEKQLSWVKPESLGIFKYDSDGNLTKRTGLLDGMIWLTDVNNNESYVDYIGTALRGCKSAQIKEVVTEGRAYTSYNHDVSTNTKPLVIGSSKEDGNYIKGLSDPVNDSDAANKAYADKFLPLSGGTLTGDLTIQNGKEILNSGDYRVHYAFGASGTAGYVKIATLTISAAYFGKEIYLKILSRYYRPTSVYIKFDQSNNTDPGLSHLHISGGALPVFLYKSASGVWDLYIQKANAWDGFDVIDFSFGATYNQARGKWAWTDVHATELPAGYVAATKRAEEINISGNAATATKAGCLHSYNSVPRQSSADIAIIGDAGVRHFLSTSSMTTAKPAGDGFITHYEWDSTGGWSGQLYVPQDGKDATPMQRRYMKSGTWSSWISILDDANVKDYVVAQGKSGDWSYRKWNNGDAECWMWSPDVSSSFSSTWGSLYVHDYLFPSKAYPFAFTSEPNVFATGRPTYGSGNTGDFFLYAGVKGTAKASPSFSAMRPTKPASAITIGICVYVKGKWK